MKMNVKGKKKSFYHEQKTLWGKCNSVAKSGSYLVMKDTEKVGAPDTLGMVAARAVTRLPCFCI